MLNVRRARRPGFSLVELVVALAILASLTAIVAIRAFNSVKQARVSLLAQDLDALKDAIIGYRGNVGRYPQQLVYLGDFPPTTSYDGGANALPAQNRDLWKGPYLDRSLVSTGLVVGEATIQNTLRRNPATTATSNFGTMFIDVVQVDSTIAAKLEVEFDGPAMNYSTGTITWVPTGGQRGTLSFGFPIKGC